MRFNELVQKLEKHGFRLIRTAKSSARLYSNGRVTIVVHYHAGKEVAEGTARKILKQAGIQ
ncbi:MAG: type II toxin-antitoxin system HicA family toxin [Lentisphaeria bacterium]|nr:type II toxin-antitoxin system HicA family toxin [Lentisphaeria bacterium]